MAWALVVGLYIGIWLVVWNLACGLEYAYAREVGLGSGRWPALKAGLFAGHWRVICEYSGKMACALELGLCSGTWLVLWKVACDLEVGLCSGTWQVLWKLAGPQRCACALELGLSTGSTWNLACAMESVLRV